MNTPVRQEPWNVMPRLQDEINRLFGNVNQNESSSATAGWIPAVDIYEYPDRFELYVDVPGVEPRGVELTLEDGVLTLSGERSATGSGNGSFLRATPNSSWRPPGSPSRPTMSGEGSMGFHAPPSSIHHHLCRHRAWLA
jgi:HSP20 family molecular chaperone IbpA